MRVNALMALAILALLWPVAALRAAVTKTTWSDAPAREFVFVENNSDDNFFVTPGGVLDPRMTGANRWTGLKYTGSGTIYQQSLGYIDNGYNTVLNANWKFDMWLENSPVSHPLTGLRCINWYAGCDMATSLILPQIHRRQRVLWRDGDQRRREVDARHDVGRVLSIFAADASRRQLYDDHQCLSDLGEL